MKRIQVKSAVAVLMMFAAEAAETLPAGTRLSVLLRTEVSSKRSKVGDPVQAVLLAPIPSDEHPILSPGLQVTGKVRAIVQRRRQPSKLQIVFDQIQRPAGSPVAISAKVVAVDNARETVDDDGTILGLRPVHIEPTKKEDLLMVAMYAHPLALASYEGVRMVRRTMEDPSIHYGRGVEMDLRLTAPLESDALTGTVAPDLGTRVPAADFAELVASQPLRTIADGRPSDQTNLLFIGAKEDLDAAFQAAGWHQAVQGGVRNDLHTFLAMFEQRGYEAAPVSTLTLEGKLPDRVYEKQTNTFSKRHHVRIWLQTMTSGGKPVWVGAATHDIGIDFSVKAKHFSHRVEPNVDIERTGIVNDLRFTGFVNTYALVERPAAQLKFENATGDHLTTDGRIAVLTLQRPLKQ